MTTQDRRVVAEDSPQHGEARLGGVTLFVEPNTRMQVSLPRDYETSWGEPGQVPYVLNIGSPGVDMHLQRPELERLHALIGRALARRACEDEEGTSEPEEGTR